jgi:hypothetical protein
VLPPEGPYEIESTHYGGTSGIMKTIIARDLTGLRA